MTRKKIPSLFYSESDILNEIKLKKQEFGKRCTGKNLGPILKSVAEKLIGEWENFGISWGEGGLVPPLIIEG